LSKTLVVITGASSGIGAAFARALAPEHDLLLIARRKDRLEAVAAQLSAHSTSRIEVLQADLTVEDDLAAAADKIRFDDRLALLVNNAGFGTVGRFWEAPLETQEKMHALHVMATVRLTHAALRNMVSRDDGAVINVASVSAFVRNAGTVSYAATKSWMTTFTEGLYLELRGIQSNVRVQALCPGFTYSGFHEAMGVPRRRLARSGLWMTAEQVVEASLDGLNRNRLFVVPGWRYKLITAFLNTLPTPLRLALESAVSRGSTVRTLLPAESPKQLS
jgi:short-subunit dehydrogenase